jgi:hypothetical protein
MSSPVEVTSDWIRCVKRGGGPDDLLVPLARVKNQCARTYKVKIVWNNGASSGCKDLALGKPRRAPPALGPSIEGVKVC